MFYPIVNFTDGSFTTFTLEKPTTSTFGIPPTGPQRRFHCYRAQEMKTWDKFVTTFFGWISNWFLTDKIHVTANNQTFEVFMRRNEINRLNQEVAQIQAAWEATHPQPSIPHAAPKPLNVAAPFSISPTIPPLTAADIPRLLGGTSDHTWKTYSLETRGPRPSITLRVGTWNLMDTCSSRTSRGKGNNPLKVDETYAEYRTRKTQQINEILNLINNSDGVADAFVLQEVDFCRLGLASQLGIDQTVPPVYPEIFQLFKTMLQSQGWNMISTDPALPQQDQDFLVTIYKEEKLSSKDKYMQGCFPQVTPNHTLQFRGGWARFQEKGSMRDLAITNLHLLFGQKPQQLIEARQAFMRQQGLLDFGAGDLNQTQNKDGLASAIMDWNYPTNVDAFPVEERGNPLKLTTKDAGLNKAYDAALCSPGAIDEVMIITERVMTTFVSNTNGPGFHVEKVDPNRTHVTSPGRPYRRQKAKQNGAS